MTRIKVMIVEPSVVITEGLAKVLSEASRIKVLEPVHDATVASERATALRPDVVILNPTLAESPSALLGDYSGPVLALVYQYVEQLRLKRYDAVIDIRESSGTMIDTLIRVAKTVEQGDREATVSYELSKRETDVLIQVAKGLTNKEIADKLNVSPHTVISHRKNIMHKTGIKSVAGLTVYAILNNLIDESFLI
ncbi:MAG: response regulator transcription factor [Muribaculaceae bacterium]|nr:response regulator transcription factor [Muribaculaceae bacterium]